MKSIKLSLFCATLLTCAPSILPSTLGGQVAYANEKSPTQSVKVPAMRDRVYTQLARAQKLSEEGQRAEGFEVLDAVKARISSLNSYERAMLFNFYGFMHYANDDIAATRASFSQVIAEEAIPNSLRISTLYSLAQLSMQQEDYSQTLAYLHDWKALNTKKITANQQVLFAQVYYQDKQYQQSLNYVNEAIALTKSKNEIPKENWLILQRANYFELKQPIEVTKVIESLVRYYDKPSYWLQLAGMYGEIEQEDKQLAVMESAWQAGYITQERDIVALSQLYRFHDVPYKAAKLLSDAIDDGIIVANEKHLDMLAQAYIAAKDDTKAIPVLVKASEIADTGKFDARLAQAYLNLEHWQKAIDSADQALTRGGIDSQGNMLLVKGMSYFNLSQFDDSLTAFKHAQQEKKSAKTAKQWFHYVEREKSMQERLAMLN